MNHATRLPIAPWNILTNILLNAVPFPMRWSPRRLHRILDAFPEEAYAPRLEVEGGLVVSCEQWRLPSDLGWHHSEPVPSKVKALMKIRCKLGLPRVVFLSPGPAKRPIPCDLENPISVLKIEEAYKKGGDILLIAMTPDPNSVFLSGQHKSHLSCALMRLPLDETPEEMADRIGPILI
ncbi:hypothetical protein SAMN05421690_100659 [Nitrosomonas sp. Nm51]|uniref:hypothetical protein n=1 Tax=Nitrosomonas sp. Nm51 TaxID=133720 RepID=UPI0008C7851B|nr:hypothetical protein [Nitrosomonas sp. Nm51]SER03830.1 hypothetical protein SAMN05421690_100659 [Nitrosomonas sp. Nm51]